ncbi:MAG: type II toxin-antitoxin system PemK/MazF family toxin [Epsilonproteobacteria bacterium]|nr:type II toxin-antitoxin system PemK/MazF family toxin [Campylobacterota bacterium]
MTEYRRGEIVSVDFLHGYRRPAIIVSDSELISILDLVSVIPLTEELIDNCEPLRVRIVKREGLDTDYDAMIEQLRAVPKEWIKESLTEVNQEEMEKVEEGIIALLHLKEQIDSSSSQ